MPKRKNTKSMSCSAIKSLAKALFLFICFCPITWVKAQTYSPKDRDEIRSRAIGLVKDFEQMLNVLATQGTTPSDVQDIVSQAIKEEGRMFFDAKVNVEDDLYALNADSMTPKDVSIEKYLNDWDLFYLKSYDETVSFTDLRLSELASKDYAYLKVYFQSQLKSKHKDFDRNFPIRKRIALIRFEKQAGQWKAWINGISFYTGKKPDGREISQAEFEEMYKPFVKEARAKLNTNQFDSTQVESQLSLQKKNDSLYAEAVKANLQKTEEQKRKDQLYQRANQRGDSLFTLKQFPAALEAYTEARAQKPFETYPRSKINELTQLLASGVTDPQKLLEQQVQEGDRKLRQRDYEAGRKAYQTALTINPDHPGLKEKMAAADKVIRNRAEIKAKYTAGNFKLALKEYSKVIAEDKNNPVYYLDRALCYQSQGDHKKALLDLNKAIELDATYADALRARAFSFQKLGDYAKAISDYSSLLSIDPKLSDVWLRKGQLLLQTQDYPGALSDFDQALMLNSKDVLAQSWQSEAYRKMGKYQEAIESAEKAFALNPNFSGGQFQKGLALLEKGEDEKGAISLQKAFKTGLNQDQDQVLDRMHVEFFSKAKEASTKGEVDQAVKWIRRAIIVKPKAHEAHLFLALQMEKAGKPDQALQSLDQALFVKEDFHPAYLKKAQILVQQKQFANALNPYYATLRWDRKNIEALIGLGDAFSALRQFDSAMVWYGEALQVKPDFAPVLVGRGKAHFKMENLRRALMDFEQAIDQDKKNAEAYFYKGKINKELKQAQKAIEDLNRALELGYNAYECAAVIGEAYADMGNHAKAIKYYTNAIKLAPDRGEAYASRGLSYLAEEDFKNAHADLDEGLKIDTALGTLKNRTELGFLKLRLNEFEAAANQFNKALDKDYLDARANYGLAVCLYNTGRFELSMRHFEQAFIPRRLEYDKIKKDPWMKSILKDKDFKRLSKAYFGK